MAMSTTSVRQFAEVSFPGAVIGLGTGGIAGGLAALYWLPAFPLARLLHEVVLDIGSGRSVLLPEALLPFLAFQAILSVGFAIGFLWMHEQLATVWWPRIRDHNPVAARYVSQYTRQAAATERRKESKG